LVECSCRRKIEIFHPCFATTVAEKDGENRVSA
jgi:hypothetical protein